MDTVRFQEIIAHIPDVITIISPEGKILFDSDAVTAVYGYAKDEQLGKNVLNYVHPLDLPNIVTLLSEVLQNPAKVYTVQLRYKHKNGSWLLIEINASYLSSIAGFNGLLIVSRDISSTRRVDNTTLMLEKAVESAGEVIFITDVKGTFTYVNPQFSAVYGFTSEEVCGKVTPRVIKSGKHAKEVYEQFWKTLLNKKIVSGEIVNKQKSGTLVTVEGSSSAIVDDKGNILGFLAIQRDISARKKLEQDLMTYKLALEHATNHIVITDPDGTILFANKGVENITGFSKEEVIGKTPRLWGRQMDKEFYEAFWHMIKDERKPFTGELRNKRKNGEVYWATASVSPIVDNGELKGFVGVEEDITERKNALKALEDSEERFEAFMQKSPSHAWMKDTTSRHVYVNETYCKFFQVTPEYMKTKTDYDLYPKDTADILHAHDLQVIAAGKPMEFEEWKPSPSGEKHVWSVYKFPFTDASGQEMVGGLAIDITERKKSEQAFQEHREELEKMNALMVGRELKMVELKNQMEAQAKEISELKSKLRQT